MLFKLLIFSAVVASCLCDTTYPVKRKPYHHHHKDYYYHHLIFGGLHYLTFLLIKVKVVFVLGAIFTFMLFAGKLYAIIKYIEFSKYKDHHHHHEPEKIYIQAPSHHHEHDYGPISYNAPPSYSTISASPSASGVTYDKLPPNAEIAGGGGGQYYDSPPPSHRFGYGRSYDENKNEGFLNNYQKFIEFIRKLNISEMAFKSMKLDSEDCRKRFVCEAEFNSKHSTIFAASLEFLRDDMYDQLKPNKTITSLDECGELYPHCTKVS